MKKSKAVKIIIILTALIILGVCTAAVYNNYFKDDNNYNLNSEIGDGNTNAIADKVVSKNDGGACPISVDFDTLEDINKDIVGWIYSVDGSVNAPILQGVDNSEYIYKSYDNSLSKGGSIFLDYRNSSDLKDLKSIIYSSNKIDGDAWLITPNCILYLTAIGQLDVPIKSDTFDLITDKSELESYLDKAKITDKNVDRIVVFSTISDNESAHIFITKSK